MLHDIRGLLLDLDGVLWLGSEPIPGAVDLIKDLRTRGLLLRFITNTSLKNKRQILAHAASLGFRIESVELITGAGTALAYIRERNYEKGMLLTSEDLKEDLRDLRNTRRPEETQYILLGDIIDGFSRAILNLGFQALIKGAELIAFHKNRFWQTQSGLAIDLGAYVAALEYSAGVTATVLGKPSPLFFRMAIQELGLRPNEVIMIGDDLESDVLGGQQAGLRTGLVLTGKTDRTRLQSSQIKPDLVLNSILDLI